MRWIARALTAPSADTDACLSIFFESQPSYKYIFNVGEGSFRASQQRKHGLTKWKAIFISAIDASASAGLPGAYWESYVCATGGNGDWTMRAGVIMSLADSGTKEINVIGPRGLDHFIASTRSYALR